MANWWPTFLLNLVALVLLWGVGLIFSVPSMVAGISVSLFNIGESQPVDLPLWYWILNGVSVLITSLFYVLLFTFWAFQYYSLEEKIKPQLPLKEDF